MEMVDREVPSRIGQMERLDEQPGSPFLGKEFEESKGTRGRSRMQGGS
jgi:hypothetical protein